MCVCVCMDVCLYVYFFNLNLSFFSSFFLSRKKMLFVGYRRFYRITAEMNEGFKQIQKHVVHEWGTNKNFKKIHILWREGDRCTALCIHRQFVVLFYFFIFWYSLLKSGHSVGTPHVYCRHTYTFAIIDDTPAQTIFISLFYFSFNIYIRVYFICVFIFIFIFFFFHIDMHVCM